MQNKIFRGFLFGLASALALSGFWPASVSADGIDVNNMPYETGQTTGICELFGGQCDWDGANNGCVSDPARSIRVGYCDGTFNNAGCCVGTPTEQQAFRDRVAAYNTIEDREFPDNGIQCSDPIDQGGPGGQCNAVSYICSEGQRAVGYCDGAGPDFLDIDPACCVSEADFDRANQNVSNTENGGGLLESNYSNGLNYTPLENIPFITTNGDFSSFLQGLFVFALVMTTLAAIFMLTVGGFMYLTSAGNTASMGNAKRTIRDALIGLILAFFAWLILNVINPDLVNLSINALSPVAIEVAPSTNVPGPGGGPAGTGDNCRSIPASDLVTIDGYQMLREAGDRFRAMRDAARAEGITLTLRSGYRSPDRQLQIWNQYGCQIVGGRAACAGGRAVAIPCSLGGNGSNHSSGHAIDIAVGCGNGNSSCNTATYRWLKQKGGSFGFYNAIPADPPHWSATGR